MAGDPLDLTKLTPEQVIVALAYQLKEVTDSLARISIELKAINQDRHEHANKTEDRLRTLEDWKTGVKAQQMLIAARDRECSTCWKSTRTCG